ncbi:MAG: DUF2087 domain-containing protein [Firmicutes bacterium]|nr:DUF2087 domain-containing protein [Bacillota bacterium]
MNSEIFWNASLSEMKQGFVENDESYVCLLCGKIVEKGIIYTSGGVLYEACRFIKIHISDEHGSVFKYLSNLDKKFTGITDHQSKLIQLFYQGKDDESVRLEMEIGSAATIRHHRFVLREKERQAKVFLAMMELLRERDVHAPAMVEIPATAKMVDDRYNITIEEQKKVLEKLFPHGPEGRLERFPIKEKQKIIVLREIVKRFDPERSYCEREINELLKPVFDDFATIRRYLIEYGFMTRNADGSIYRTTSGFKE